MLKKTLFLALALVFAVGVGTATAQSAQCLIGVYANPDGTGGYLKPTEFQPFHVYVVMFTEDLVNAAAYRLSAPGLGSTLFYQNSVYGPEGAGIGLVVGGGGPADGDISVGLAACAVGFSGYPILVTDYTFIASSAYTAAVMSVLPNTDENPVAPVYSDCQGTVKTCDNTVGLTVDTVIATESKTMGAVKALYN